ncbi:hypothetical protein FOA52_005437 [Chlamydomonas sp. UWO 241]|nr:hypothetical protein FOA52_005437 [Chlamydomonas sp. UWO 241]
MPNVHLSRIGGLEPVVSQALLASNLSTARDVLLLSLVDLVELLNITRTQAVTLQHTVSAHVCPAFTSALDLTQQASVVLPMGLPTMDACLRRGVPAGSVTELVGPAGVGKSQMCFQLALLCTAPVEAGGLGATVMFVDTERKFSSGRFAEMAKARFPAVLGPGAPHGLAALSATMTRVMILQPANVEQLVAQIESLEAGVIEFRVALIIIDSIAALARAEFGGGGPSGGIIERQEMLGSIAVRLKHLAEAFRIPVVVTNQVTTRLAGPATVHAFQHSEQGVLDTAATTGGYVMAALGTKWAHCVNVRVVLERLADRRFMKIAKSPSCANVALEYRVGPCGIEEVEGAEMPEAPEHPPHEDVPPATPTATPAADGPTIDATPIATSVKKKPPSSEAQKSWIKTFPFIFIAIAVNLATNGAVLVGCSVCREIYGANSNKS